MKKITLAIDAITIKSQGGIVHLDGILHNFNNKNIQKIYVLVNNIALKSLANKKKYSKKIVFIRKKVFNTNNFFIFFWQLFHCDNYLKKINCTHLISLCGYYFGNFNKTVIFSQNALPFVNIKGYNFFYKLKLLLQKKAQISSIKKFKKVIFVSKFQKSLIKKNLSNFKINNKVIYHGINDKIKRKKKYKNRYKKFLYVSQINFYKNQINLINAFNNLIRKGYKIKLDCFGHNHIDLFLKNKYIKISKSINQEKINKIYHKYDAFIFPSLVESFGLPILEAARSGLPICCSNLNVFKEILNKKNLIIFNAKKITDIENKIVKVISTKQTKLKIIVKENYVRSLKYNWKTCSNEFFNFIEKI